MIKLPTCGRSETAPRPYNSDASRFQLTYWAHHDFTDQTVLPGEIRTSEVPMFVITNTSQPRIARITRLEEASCPNLSHSKYSPTSSDPGAISVPGVLKS